MGGDSGSLKYPYIEAARELRLLDGTALFLLLSVFPETETVRQEEQRLRDQAICAPSLAPSPSCRLGKALGHLNPCLAYPKFSVSMLLGCQFFLLYQE